MNTAVNANVALPGYHLVERLYSGARTVVYRGIRLVDYQPVVVKLLQQDYPSFYELLQFRNQYTIAKNLNIPGIVHPYSLESYRNSYALVMEDFGGVSLRDYTCNRALAIAQALEIALQVADVLHDLHQNRVIHKDIKPANILIHPETKQVKLIDFSIASLLPKETQEIKNPNGLEGTLAYLAPEQTGRMNRGIDYRTDFYALGVTLFELLTGQLPFESQDPMELVHCHIAKQPPSLGNTEEIPSVLEDIAIKLMAKNAEERYQSALGLKYDLEICLNQLKEKGEIQAFEIGQRDLCDRFIIPEKLYGREREVQTLLQAFERVASGSSELMLVAGFSGIGKTAVVNEVHKPIVRQRGYFIKGKFDQFNRNIPLSAFVQALRDLMGQLLSESDAQLAQWQAKILTAVGENGQVLIDVIPELEQIIGKQAIAAELSGSAAQNRFNLLFQKFIEVFTTVEHPLVLFLDDLQWVDSASLQLIELLMNDNGYLLMLGAYRDNEVSPAHPFIMTVAELKKAKAISLRERCANVNTITLAPLAFEDTNHLIADTLNCSTELAQPLTELVDRKTQGNPFFATQFLKALHEDGYITFNGVGEASQNENRCYWECDITQINTLSLTDDVVEFMALQLRKLPATTQQVLKLAACIGNQFDLATLAIVSEQSSADAAIALWKALQEGLVLPTSQIYKFFQDADRVDVEVANPQYRFLHDRVQQAAYALIPNEQKQATHLTIGRLLRQNTSLDALAANIFEIVNHFSQGVSLIQSADEKTDLLHLYLLAGQKAKASVAYDSALNYLNAGLNLLTESSWQDRYDLTLALHVEATEVSFLSTDFERSQQLAEVTLKRARTVLDKIKVYEVKILSYVAQNQPLSAIQVTLDVLESLGIPLENEAPQNLAIADLNHLPKMTDPTKLAVLQLLVSTYGSAIIGAPDVFPKLVFTAIKLCQQFGNSATAAVSYVFYGLILANLGDVHTGYQFGELAIQLLDRFDSRPYHCVIQSIFNHVLRHWKNSLRETIQPAQEAMRIGLETGDLFYVSCLSKDTCTNLFLAGENLEDVTRQQLNSQELLQKLKQLYSIYYGGIWHQLILNLRDLAENRYLLVGDGFNEIELLPQLETEQNKLLLFNFYIAKGMLLYLLEDYENSVTCHTAARKYVEASAAMATLPTYIFYDSLSLLAQYHHSALEQTSYIEQIQSNQDKMGYWSDNAPQNFRHKHDLVEAERYRVLGNRAEAIALYDRAISLAKENGYIQEEALANELAAKFYLDWGKEKVAAGYMQEAYYCYAKWGAKAKTDDLEKRYPQLLQPILQQATQALTVLETLASIATPAYSIHSTRSQSSSSTSLNNTLDFAALLKVSQAISSTIQLDDLLQTLTQTMLENSGADKCALMLCQDGQWLVRAIADLQQTMLQTVPLEDNLALPVPLINYVKNTLEAMVLDNLKTALPVAHDPYLQQHQPKSVLCLPILNQGNLAGILYLENRLTSGVFTSDRLVVLNFLCTQAAIALENARLYRQVQQTLEALQQAQLQLVQSEKMSALGNLVAGVAHEINNPIGCIVGNVGAVQDYVNDLLGIIDLYGEEVPQPSAKIEAELEAIDLEYVREDLPKLIKAMKDGGDRIKSISNSLRTFSRADSDTKQKFNLHEGIDSTILILRHRLKANEHRPAIEVVTEYGNLPKIACFPGQLNQVFMNILANAIDALDESNIGRSFADIQAIPNRITIRTTVENGQVKIAIADNGKGMPEEVKSRIFDHLFTTKGVGKGTGLGLAIARQIVVEKHGGTIDVNSEVGKGTEFVLTLPIG